jgi:hypothetical protein
MTDGSLRTAATPKRSFRDRMRTDWYLTRLDWHLEGLVPGRERKATLRELRQALAGDPRDTTAALADLGAPRTLARQYARESPLRPLWSVGAAVAALALFVYWSAFLLFTLGMLAAVDSNAPAEAHATFLFVDVEAFSFPDAVGIGWTSSWNWLIVPGAIVVVSFLLGARAWRVARQPSH